MSEQGGVSGAERAGAAGGEGGGMIAMAPGEEEELRRLGRRPCNSCDGNLVGHEPGGVCQRCLDDWRDWHRVQRESDRRWVEARMRGEA